MSAVSFLESNLIRIVITLFLIVYITCLTEYRLLPNQSGTSVVTSEILFVKKKKIVVKKKFQFFFSEFKNIGVFLVNDLQTKKKYLIGSF